MKINRKATLGPIHVSYSRRTADEPMGRFGGGWRWKIGVQASRSEAIISLLVCEVGVIRLPRCEMCRTYALPGFTRTSQGYARLCKAHSREAADS